MYRARKSNMLGKITIVVVICCFCLPAQAKYGGGSGTAEKPYLIYDENQMNAIGADYNDWDKHFKLMADVDLGQFDGKEGRETFNVIGEYKGYNDPDNRPFTGVFDGDGHTIANFTYNSNDRRCIGLFRYIDDPNAKIKEIGLVGPNVDAGMEWYVGSLVGYLENGTLMECYVEGGVVSGGEIVGGLVGIAGELFGFVNNAGTITNCYSTCSVSGFNLIGGLVGGNGGTITNCYSSSDVSGMVCVAGLVAGNNNLGTITDCHSSGDTFGSLGTVGGLTASNGGTITNCYSTGNVTVVTLGFTGGLVGSNDGKITNCYSEVDVSASWWSNACGGLVGIDERGTITNCYAAGNVEGGFQVGGLVGLAEGGAITNCYSTASVTGQSDVGGLVGSGFADNVFSSFWDIESSGQSNSNGGIGKTTAQMQMASTFLHWGTCEGVWTINEGLDYPRLAWEQREGEPIVGTFPFQGEGNSNSPYLIHTPEQLNVIGLLPCVWDKHFKLMANIDLSQYAGIEFNIIVRFMGTFDGNGHTIFNFSYTSVDADNRGLFGHVYGANAQIKDLGVLESNVDAGTGDYVGSLVGQLSGGAINGCYAEGGSVSGDYYVGGLVGYNSGGTIYNCYANGTVHSYSSTHYGGIGGLVGRNNGTITNCYANGTVHSYSSHYGGIGGLVGRNNGTITNCYSTGSVSGTTDIGGLVGRNYSGSGIIASFWDIETSGQTDSDGGMGLPTIEMQMQVTFSDADWDFNTPVWTIDEGNDYPRLWWEFVPVLHPEPEVTLGTSNTIYWEPITGDIEYYTECAKDADFNNIVYNSGWITETSYEFTGLELGKRYWYSVKARNAEGTETNWSNVVSSLQCTLADAIEITLNMESLKNENMKNTLLNKIDEALEMIDEGLYKDALNKFQNDILQKTNGCAETGEPDKNDWIITCEEQSDIYPLIIETIECVKSLMH